MFCRNQLMISGSWSYGRRVKQTLSTSFNYSLIYANGRHLSVWRRTFTSEIDEKKLLSKWELGKYSDKLRRTVNDFRVCFLGSKMKLLRIKAR